jgi:hypothetical protein
MSEVYTMSAVMRLYVKAKGSRGGTEKELAEAVMAVELFLKSHYPKFTIDCPGISAYRKLFDSL